MDCINCDILKAIRRANREEEIALYGKQILFRNTITENKKKYKRSRDKFNFKK